MTDLDALRARDEVGPFRCKNCGSTETLASIQARRRPGADHNYYSCCPERDLAALPASSKEMNDA